MGVGSVPAERDGTRGVDSSLTEGLDVQCSRFELLKDNEQGDQRKAFHYGTHYSSAAIVLYYMIRIQPFTEQHVRLQVRSGNTLELRHRLLRSAAL